MLLTDLVQLLTSLAGVTAFIVMLVNLLGFLGLFTKDGAKGTANTALQLLALLGLLIAKSFFPDVDLGLVDQYAAHLANIGIAILGLVPVVLGTSRAMHAAMAGTVPVVGFSNSAGDETLEEIVAPAK